MKYEFSNEQEIVGSEQSFEKIVMNDDVQKDENKINAKFFEIPIFDSEAVCCISIRTRFI